jgi:hypothetical protein
MAGRTSEPGGDREPTPEPDDVDTRFAEIAASLGDLTLPPADDPQSRVDRPTAPTADGEPQPGPRDFELGPEVDDLDDDEPGFVPEEPPPLGAADPVVVAAWVGIAASVTIILVYLALWRGMPGVLVALAGPCFLLSVGLLVWRLPRSRDSDGGDGAVV